MLKTASTKGSDLQISSAPQKVDMADASIIIRSEDSSLVGESDSWESGAGASPQGSGPLHMSVRPAKAAPPCALQSDFEGSRSAGQPTLSSDRPLLIVRTESVKRGRKASFRVLSEETGGHFSQVREVYSSKSLRHEVHEVISDRPEVLVDLSLGRTKANSAPGVRCVAVKGLLTSGSRKLILDLSNVRLSKWYECPFEQSENIDYDKAWRKAFRDSEASELVEALRRELERAAVTGKDMPEFALICHDQSLSEVVYPLMKTLALHAASLHGLTKLDLSRYSRSEEVCEAAPGSPELAHAFDKFVYKLMTLMAANPALQELRLRMNGIHPDAMTLIAAALANSATIERLDLSCNPLCQPPASARVSRAGIRVLASVLGKHTSLRLLDLSFCGIDGKAADALLPALASNKKLELVNLGGNPIFGNHGIFKDPRAVTIGHAGFDG